MIELIQRSFQLLLDEMGIDEKRQFMLGVFVGIVALVVYSVRDRHQHGLTVTLLFTVLGLSALVFLFTESEAARHWSALIGGLAIVGILTCEFVRRRRAAASSDAAEAQTSTSSSSSLVGCGGGGGGGGSVVMTVQRVDSLDDPRIALYRNLKDRELERRGRHFIAEGEHLSRRLARQRFPGRFGAAGRAAGGGDRAARAGARARLRRRRRR